MCMVHQHENMYHTISMRSYTRYCLNTLSNIMSLLLSTVQTTLWKLFRELDTLQFVEVLFQIFDPVDLTNLSDFLFAIYCTQVDRVSMCKVSMKHSTQI